MAGRATTAWTCLLFLEALWVFGVTGAPFKKAASSHRAHGLAYAPPPLDRVPTFRLYHKGMCCDQIGGGGEVEDARKAIHASIKKAMGNLRVPPAKRPGDVLELQSIPEMETFLQDTEEKWALIEFYGAWCQQCQVLDPLFQTLPFVYRDKPLIFGRADIARFHELVAKKDQEQEAGDLKKQLEDMSQRQPLARKGIVERSGMDAEDRIKGCLRCGGTGFIDCDVCGTKGHVVRTAEGFTVADICPACVGHKKLPCPDCGGKCYMCE